MKKSMQLIAVARIIPNWVYGRELLVKIAIMYAMVTAMSAIGKMEA